MLTDVNSPATRNPMGSPGPVHSNTQFIGGSPDQMPLVPVDKLPTVLTKRSQSKNQEDMFMNPLLKNIKDLVSMLNGKPEQEHIMDHNLKTFYNLATKEEDGFLHIGLYNIDFYPQHNLSKKFQMFNNLDNVISSPDGKMAAGITLWGTPVVFNLRATYGEKKFRILDDIISDVLKPQDDDFEQEEDFNEGENNYKIKERMQNVKELKMTFSPDSSFLVVSSANETLAYDLRNLFLGAALPVNKVNLVSLNLKGQASRGKVLFQYFFKTNFNNSLYIPVDRQILVIAYQKTIKFIVFCLDNYYKSETNFLPPNFEIPFSSFSFTKMFNDEEHKKDPIMSFEMNQSNFFAIHRRTILGKNTVECYKFDLDTKGEKSQSQDNKGSNKKHILSIRYNVELPSNTQVYLKTLSPSGYNIFAYNTKLGMIQRLKFKDRSEKIEIENVFKLTGKRKNLKHLAVKDDGKYLLLVDSNANAEVMYRAGPSHYVCIHSFNAMTDSQILIKSGLIEKSKGMTEHDVTNMDFLEDGSGVLSFFSSVVMVQPLSLSESIPNHCLFNNRHFFFSNLRKRHNGMYSSWLKKDNIRYQKIIDFNPETNRGCIVRTFKETKVKSMHEILLPPEMFYKDLYYSDSKGSQKKDNFRALKDQLESLFDGDYYETDNEDDERDEDVAEVKILNIPNQQVEAYILQKHDLITAYRREDIQRYHQQYWAKSSNLEQPKIHWSRTVPLPDPDDNELYYMAHLSCFVDNQAIYITVPKSGNEGGTVFDMIQTEIPKGVGLFPLNKSTILVSRETEDVVNDMMTEDEKKVARNSVLMMFDMNTRQFILDKKLKTGFQEPYNFMLETDNSNIKALIGPNAFGLYNVNDHKLIYEKFIFDGDKDSTAGNIEFDNHMFLRSPNGKMFVFSSIDDSNKIVYFKLRENNAPLRKVPVISSRMKKDYMNRWCFSHDSKYLLILVNEQISVFSTEEGEVITKINLDKLATVGKILNLELRQNSTILEIAIGYKNYIFFKRMSFYPTSNDLMLYDLNKKLDELSRTLDIQERDNLQKEVTDIMTSLPLYQRFLDATYLKLLCLFDNNMLTSNYFNKESQNKQIVWKSPYSMLVSTGDLMFAHSANSFIDLLEDTLNQEGELPPIDYNILLRWMQSGKLQIAYKRKLMNLLTFKPFKYDLSGELKNPQISMAKIPLTERGENDPKWLHKVEKELLVQDSANKQEFDCYRTAIRFDLSNGNTFSLDYFRWMEDMTDEELKTKYSSVIYYKWNRIIKYAIIYSCVFWILNALLCAFMAFAWTQWGLAIPILILNLVFICYEAKCFYSMPKMSYKDKWNYYDIFMHLYCFSCVLALITGGGEELSYEYNWLRVTCFGVVSWRGMAMLRIFQATRYLLTMLFQVFGKMVAFLCVFVYIIFIYWFICLVRPALVSEGEDETLYASIQQAINIAFSNFDADLDSVIVFITTVMGQIVLALVMLNFLIAIISKVYDEVAAERELYDVKMLLQLIVEFGCFLNRSTKSETPVEYFIVIPKLRQSEALDDITQAFDEEKEVLNSEINTVLKDYGTETKTLIEKATASHMDPIRKALDALQKRIDEIQTKQAGSKKAVEQNKKQSFEAEIEEELKGYRSELEKEFKSWEKKRQLELEQLKVEVEAELKKQEELEAAKKKEEEEKKLAEEKAAKERGELLLPQDRIKLAAEVNIGTKPTTDLPVLPKRSQTLGGKLLAVAENRFSKEPKKSQPPVQEGFIGPMLPPTEPPKKENRYELEVKNFETQKTQRLNTIEEQVEIQRAKLEEEKYQNDDKDDEDDDYEYDDDN